jgi:hypothetical protein
MKRVVIHLLFAIGAALLLAAPMPEAALSGTPAATTSQTTSTHTPGDDTAWGFDFTANADLLVTHLGLWDEGGRWLSGGESAGPV